MFEENFWSLKLANGVPAELPIPENSIFAITQIQSTDLSAEKITIELISTTIRVDKIQEQDDQVTTQIDNVFIASVFPKVNPTQTVMLPFSTLNKASLCANGGDVIISGIYKIDNDVLEEAAM